MPPGDPLIDNRDSNIKLKELQKLVDDNRTTMINAFNSIGDLGYESTTPAGTGLSDDPNFIALRTFVNGVYQRFGQGVVA